MKPCSVSLTMQVELSREHAGQSVVKGGVLRADAQNVYDLLHGAQKLAKDVVAEINALVIGLEIGTGKWSVEGLLTTPAYCLISYIVVIFPKMRRSITLPFKSVDNNVDERPSARQLARSELIASSVHDGTLLGSITVASSVQLNITFI